MTWQEYEKEVFENLSLIYSDAKLEFNCQLLGKYSKGHRQCDTIVRKVINDVEYVTLVDAKYYSKKIDVKDVETFISMVKDIDADYGILVSPKGYTELAYQRAEYDPSPILLDLLTLKDLKEFQGYFAIPYSGENGVILAPSFGWIIDGTRRQDIIASSYRKGFSFEQALEEREFIYFQFWNTRKKPISAEVLLRNQENKIKENSMVFESEIEKIEFNSRVLFVRKSVIENYLGFEIVCAIEYDGFIFYGVLISPANRESVNKIKLLQMVSKTLPVKISQNR